MASNSVSYRKSQVQPRILLIGRIKFVNDSEAMQLVAEFETFWFGYFVKSFLAFVPERSVAKIVPNRDCLDKMLIEPHCACNSRRNGSNMQAMLQTGA